MDNLIYAKAIARLKVLETRLLDKVKYERMIDSLTPQDSIKVIEESEYSKHLSRIKEPYEYDILLQEELKRVYALMYEVSPVPILVDMMSVAYDYHNIKVLLKEKVLNTDLSYLLMDVGTVDIKKLRTYIDSRVYPELNPIMAKAIKEAEEKFIESKDPQTLDMVVDEYQYEDMLAKATELGNEFVLNYVRITIDLINIKTLFRVIKQKRSREFINKCFIKGGNLDNQLFINALNDPIDRFVQKLTNSHYGTLLKGALQEYSTTGRVITFEKASQDFITEYIKKTKYISFGPEPLLAYLISKETEIKNVRMIMVGKLNAVEPERIRERLREIYV